MATKRQVDEYLEAALWSSNDESDERGGEPMDRNYSVSDFSPEARARAQLDLDIFESEMEHVLDAIGDERFDLDLDSWPYDFWLTRNGHGVGFWDRPERYGPIANALTALAQRAGEVHAYVGVLREFGFYLTEACENFCWFEYPKVAKREAQKFVARIQFYEPNSDMDAWVFLTGSSSEFGSRLVHKAHSEDDVRVMARALLRQRLVIMATRYLPNPSLALQTLVLEANTDDGAASVLSDRLLESGIEII